MPVPTPLEKDTLIVLPNVPVPPRVDAKKPLSDDVLSVSVVVPALTVVFPN